MGGEFKLIGNLARINVRTISGGFPFSVHTFDCKDENLKLLNLQAHILSYTTK